ncbi:MAG: tetratricopeptide repeat protein [Planctomycetota bacterium]
MVETAAPGKPTHRVLLYGIAILVAVALLVMGIVVPAVTGPDAGTLLGMAEVHLGMAEVTPLKDKSGRTMPFRAEQLAKAKEILEQVEEIAPGLGITREYRAYHAWIGGDMDEAARFYTEVLRMSGDDPAMRHKTLLNLAQVELVRKQAAAANAHLERIPTEERGLRWHLTSARIHDRQGRSEARSKALRAARTKAGSNQKEIKSIADFAFASGDEIALSCYETLQRKSPMDWYRIARLKMANGYIDSAKDALNHVREANPALLGELIKKDREIWEAYGVQGFSAESDKDATGTRDKSGR